MKISLLKSIARRRKAPTGDALKVVCDTIPVGSGSNPDTLNNYPDLNRMAQVT
jgi:hypothetical protein